MAKRVSKNYNSALIEALSAKPIGFNPLLAELSGSALAGLFLSQLLYWWGKGARTGWIYKTIDEFRAETTMTRSEQGTAIRKWKDLSVVEVVVRGIPPKRHFKIDISRLVFLLEKRTGKRVSIHPDRFAESGESIFRSRPNTTESTQKNTNRDFSLQERTYQKGLNPRQGAFLKKKAELAKKLEINRGPGPPS